MARLFSPHIGGVEKHVAGLSAELSKRGHTVRIITEQYDETLPLHETTNELEIFRLPYPTLNSKIRTWRWILSSKKLFDWADLVHVHDVYWWTYPLPDAWRKKFFITFHGYEDDPPKLSHILQRRVINSIVAGSIGVGEFIEQAYGTKLNVVTYGAADLKPTPLPRLRKAVFVGRLEADTGILEYIRIMPKLPSEYTLEIYGDGPLKDTIIQLVKDPKNRATYCGVCVNSGAVLESASDVFASQYLTILEAMQLGRPVWAVADTTLKKSYLKCHPMYANMIVGTNSQTLYDNFIREQPALGTKIKQAQTWALKQNTAHLTDKYLYLWNRGL